LDGYSYVTGIPAVGCFLSKPGNVRIADKLSISPLEYLKGNSEIGGVNDERKIPIRVQ
jgi:hypothetical protein